MNQFNTLEYKKILGSKTVGIAGAGGLGSNCAVSLARVGIGKLIIADFDVISESNLNRQYYFIDQVGQPKVFALKDNISRINPRVIVDIHPLRLTPETIVSVYHNADIIIEAFDLAEMKQMIIETVLSVMQGKIIVSGVGLAGWGNFNSLRIQQIGNLYICGDQLNEVSEQMPPLAPRVGIVANMQANLVMEILINRMNYGNNTE